MTVICRTQLPSDHEVEVEIQTDNKEENGGNITGHSKCYN